MSLTNILANIWKSYEITTDCIKIASRSVAKKEYHPLTKATYFATDLADDVANQLIESRQSVDDYVILSLYAAFERMLFNYLKDHVDEVFSHDNSKFSSKFRDRIGKEIEYWKPDDVLDVFKSIVKSDLIGQAKQVKKYRDWVAHKNPNKPPPTNVLPLSAYNILFNVLKCLS